MQAIQEQYAVNASHTTGKTQVSIIALCPLCLFCWVEASLYQFVEWPSALLTPWLFGPAQGFYVYSFQFFLEF